MGRATRAIHENETTTHSPGEERGQESVDTVIRLLQYFPWIVSLQETEKFSHDDMKGFDLIAELNPEMNLRALCLGQNELNNKLNIQVKSSEERLKLFYYHGRNKFRNSKRWVKDQLIVLNGQLQFPTILADFYAQLANLAGLVYDDIPDNPLWQEIPSGIQSAIHQVIVRGIIEESRGEMLDWIAHSYGNGKKDPQHMKINGVDVIYY